MSAGNIRVTKTTSMSFNRLTLADLRDFVDACAGLSGTATVNVRSYAGDMREPGYTTLTVNDAR